MSGRPSANSQPPQPTSVFTFYRGELFFPRLSLVGSIGQEAQHGGDLPSASSMQFSVGPSLHWPIFAGGSIRANIRAADARADAASARYENALPVLCCRWGDGETATQSLPLPHWPLPEARSGDVVAPTSGPPNRVGSPPIQRYPPPRAKNGLIVLLDAQSAYSAAEQQSIGARAARLDAMVALYKALGGGWEGFEIKRAANEGRSAGRN